MLSSISAAEDPRSVWSNVDSHSIIVWFTGSKTTMESNNNNNNNNNNNDNDNNNNNNMEVTSRSVTLQHNMFQHDEIHSMNHNIYKYPIVCLSCAWRIPINVNIKWCRVCRCSLTCLPKLMDESVLTWNPRKTRATSVTSTLRHLDLSFRPKARHPFLHLFKSIRSMLCCGLSGENHQHSVGGQKPPCKCAYKPRLESSRHQVSTCLSEGATKPKVASQ